MKIKVEESIRLEDGSHEGVIDDVTYKEVPYKYTEVVVLCQVQGKEVKVNVSFPTNVTENSALGEALTRFGAKLEVGTDIQPEEFFTKGKKVIFQTITKGKYYKVVLESLKPKE